MAVFDIKKIKPMILNTKRRCALITQSKLQNLSGVAQSRISLYESGEINLSEKEKSEIEKVLGGIIWIQQNNEVANSHNLDDFAMPEESLEKPKSGLKIRRLKNAGLEKPEVIWIGEKEDHSRYTYEEVKK